MSIALQSSLAFLAGALTIASPCVLPLVPIVLIGARRKHPLAPLMLGLGLVFTFTSAAFILAIAGPALGLDPDIVRIVTAGLMVALGLIRTGRRSKQIMGLALAVTGIFVLSGTDRVVEGWAVENSPAWLSDLTTSI